MTVANSISSLRISNILARSLTGFVCLLVAAPLLAQQPDPQGWANGSSVGIAPPLITNQPGSTSLPKPPLSDEPGSDVRQQIGLASFEEAVSPQTPDENSEFADDEAGVTDEPSLSDLFASQNKNLTSRDGLASSIKVALLLATLSLAPAIVLMTTCYVRIIVVLTLLRQAFGAQQLPPTQVLTALSLFVTLLVMTPVWNQVKTEAIDPYTQENGISWEEACERGVIPVKSFMARQINLANNGESIALFYKYLPDQSMARPESPEDAPLNVLLPAFMVSELKVAFLLGFQIYLPFLVLDLVVSSVTVSTGMLMLPPTMVSLPLKLILFVLVDGWNLVVGMLLQSFGAFP